MTEKMFDRSRASIKEKLRLTDPFSGPTLFVKDRSLDVNIRKAYATYLSGENKYGARGPFRSALLFVFNSPAKADVAGEYFRAAMMGLHAQLPNKEKGGERHCSLQFKTAAVRVQSALGAGETAVLFFHQNNDLAASHIARTNAREGLGGRLISLDPLQD